jgi:hypothetical protein
VKIGFTAASKFAAEAALALAAAATFAGAADFEVGALAGNRRPAADKTQMKLFTSERIRIYLF